MNIELSLDIDKDEGRFSSVDNPIILRQGDAVAYALDVAVTQGAEAMDLTGWAVRLYARKPDGAILVDGENVQVVDPPAGRVLYTVPRQLTAVSGIVALCYLRLTQGAASATTPDIAIRVAPSIGEQIVSTDYMPEVDALLAEMEAQRDSYATAEDGRQAIWQTLRVEAEDVVERGTALEAAVAEAEAARQAAELLRLAADETRTTFVPNVTNDGVISWTNDKDLPNPAPRNIKGADGAVVSVDSGLFGMTVEDGRLYMTVHDGAEQPPLSIEDGHLVYTVS